MFANAYSFFNPWFARISTPTERGAAITAIAETAKSLCRPFWKQLDTVKVTQNY
jgi:hypothetical protein